MPVAALDEACRLLGVRGRVLPATTDPVVLKAEADGGEVDGQVAVMATDNIRTVSLVPPDPAAPSEALTALREADQIVMGPGSLFTSVLAALAVPDIREGIRTATRPEDLCLQPPSPGPRDRAFRRGPPCRGAGGARCLVDMVVCDTSGMPLGRPRVDVVDALWPGPTGWPTTRPNWRRPSPICSDDALNRPDDLAWNSSDIDQQNCKCMGTERRATQSHGTVKGEAHRQ